MKKIFGIIFLLSFVHSNNLNCMDAIPEKVAQASQAYLEVSNALNDILNYKAGTSPQTAIQTALVNLLDIFVAAHGVFIKTAPSCMQNNFFNDAIFSFIQNKIDRTLGQYSSFLVIDWFAQMEIQIKSVNNKLNYESLFIEG